MTDLPRFVREASRRWHVAHDARNENLYAAGKTACGSDLEGAHVRKRVVERTDDPLVTETAPEGRCVRRGCFERWVTRPTRP